MINDNKDSIKNNGDIYLIDNGFSLILYLQKESNEKIIYDLFEVKDINEIIQKKLMKNIFLITVKIRMKLKIKL